MNNSALVVIPCRIGSTRFPNKPCAMIAGRSLVERVWRNACAASEVNRVIVATDSEQIANHCRSFGAEVMLTSESCRTGTDRVAEVASRILSADGIVINLQGDAVLTPPWVIDAVIAEMRRDPQVKLATPMVQLVGDSALEMVKQKKSGNTTGTLVTFDCHHNALYFSKNLIPNPRDGIKADTEFFLHIGLYGYRSAILAELSELPLGRFEKAEQLEQLRALEHGIPIRMVEVNLRGRSLCSVDNPGDVAIVERIIALEGELLHQ